jgi:hypothetical protein
MTTVFVNVTHHQHVCPGNSQAHVWDTRRAVVMIVPGGPCQTPITIGVGDTAFTIDCGRRLASHLRCPACRTDVINRTVTTLPPTGQPTDAAPDVTGCQNADTL